MSKADDAAFLSTEFDLAPTRAASLVGAPKDEALELAAAEVQRQKHHNLYGDAPVPPLSDIQPEPGNGGLQKPVIGTGKASAD